MVLRSFKLKMVLFSLPIGQVSDPVSTQVGDYLIKVLERNDAGKVPFERAQSDLRDALLNQEVEKRLPSFLDQLKKEFNVEIVKPGTAKK